MGWGTNAPRRPKGLDVVYRFRCSRANQVAVRVAGVTETTEDTGDQGMGTVARQVERAGSGLGYGLWAGFIGALALATVYFGVLAVLLILVGVGILLMAPLARWMYRLSVIFADKASYALGYRLIVPDSPAATGTPWQRFRRTVAEPATYRTALWTLMMGVTGVIAGSLILVVVFGFARELTVPLWWWALPEGAANSALGAPINTWVHAISVTATAPLYLAAALWVLPALCALQARLCAWVLGCAPVSEQPGPGAGDPMRGGPSENTQPQPADPRLERLTPREREVLALMSAGFDNAAIAEELVVSQAAVLKHIRSIFVKLDLPPGESGHRRVRAVLMHLGSAADQ